MSMRIMIRRLKRVLDQIRKCRRKIEQEEKNKAVVNGSVGNTPSKAVEDLKALIEACVKNNFVGVENSRLYSQTYYGTKYLVQEFIDEGMFWFVFGVVSVTDEICSRERCHSSGKHQPT